jgi:putative glutamine amidotransferase
MRPAPIIGVTTSVTIGVTPERAYVNAAYVRAVQDAGGVPVPLPPPLDGEARAALWRLLDGVVLTGGGDVDPARFGQACHPAVAEVSSARDTLEIDLTHWALGRRLPLLAICRGIQVLNVALGGTLHQDIPSDFDHALAHSQKEPRHQPTHRVKVEGGTRLASILGAAEVEVNSFHHQALARLGSGLRAVAWSPDGIIEGVEMGDERGLVVGVQWHPEDLTGHDAAARNLFRALVDESRALR